MQKNRTQLPDLLKEENSLLLKRNEIPVNEKITWLDYHMEMQSLLYIQLYFLADKFDSGFLPFSLPPCHFSFIDKNSLWFLTEITEYHINVTDEGKNVKELIVIMWFLFFIFHQKLFDMA